MNTNETNSGSLGSVDRNENIARLKTDFVNRLTGNTDGLREIPKDRLDWWGVESALDLYNATAGEDRTDLITAMGDVLSDPEQESAVVGQTVFLANSLDLSMLEPQVQGIRGRMPNLGSEVEAEVNNFIAMRKIRETTSST